MPGSISVRSFYGALPPAGMSRQELAARANRIRNRAATTIQRVVRGHLARRRVDNLRRVPQMRSRIYGRPFRGVVRRSVMPAEVRRRLGANPRLSARSVLRRMYNR